METKVSGLRGPSERLLPALLGAAVLLALPLNVQASTTAAEPVAPTPPAATAHAGPTPQNQRATPTSLIEAQRARVSPKPRPRTDLDCLARAIYYEARAEPLQGQIAVAEVVMNRVKSRRYPSTVCGVVEQRMTPRVCQFSFECNPRLAPPKGPAWVRARELAAKTLAGKAPRVTGGATHFHASRVSPEWARVYTMTIRIGNHLFYRKGGPRLDRAVAQATDSPVG